MHAIMGHGFCLMAVVGGCARMEPGADRAPARPAVQVAQPIQEAQGQADAGGMALPADRKIIYTADVVLITEDLDGFRSRLTSTLEEFQGFVATQELKGRAGSQRTGIWTVRIPVAQFAKFLDQLITWGELESQSITSSDVTEEFVDLEARVKNKRVEEQRLLQILEEKTGELEQVVALERAISEVREQIERMEGRLRYLSEKVDLTTVAITVREIQDYVPPQPPTLGTEIARTFHGSVQNLQEVAKELLLVAVAVSPWLIPVAVIALPTALFLRRLQRRSRK